MYLQLNSTGCFILYIYTNNFKIIILIKYKLYSFLTVNFSIRIVIEN